MALFHKRPLACACACFAVTVFLSYFVSAFLSFLLAFVLLVPTLALLGICLFRGFSYRKLFLLLVIAALALGTFCSAWDRAGSEKWKSRNTEQAVTAELVIKEVLYQNAYGTELLAKTESIALEESDETVVLRFNFSVPFRVGDHIKGDFLIRELDFEAYREGAAQQYFSDGAKLLLVGEDAQTLSLTESGVNTLSAVLSHIRTVAAFRISDTIGGEEGKLLAAMLLGTKEELADTTVRDFRLAGVSHLLALSGLHLMILVGLVDRLLYFLHASKRVRIAVVLPLCLFYLVLTGCNYSLLRAMLMLGAVYVSFLLRERSDALTALFFSAAVILCFTPFAVFSLSFQMTMLATLGILAFARLHSLFYKLLPVKKGWRGLLRKLLHFVLSSLLITLTTTLCLAPVLWLSIGSYSLMTPLANLALVPIAPALLFGAVLVLLLPFSAVGAAVGLVAKLTLYLAQLFAGFDLMISFVPSYVPFVLIPLLAASTILLLLDLKKRYWLTLTPLAAAILAFAILIPVSHHLGRSQLQVTYRREGSSEGLILVQNTSAVICDVSGGSLTQWRADWYAAQEIGATRLEVLMLTHYHSRSVSALSRFSQSTYIHALWLPTPQTQNEREILAQLLEIAQKRDLTVTVYDHDRALSVFEYGTLTLQAPLYYARSTEPAFSLDVTFAGKTLCYHTAALSEYLRGQEKTHSCRATHLILGAHGPVPHATVEIPQVETLTSVLVGSEKALSFLEMRPSLSYFAFSEKNTYILE